MKEDWRKGLSKKQVRDAKVRGRKWGEAAGRPQKNNKGPKSRKKK